MMGRFAAFALTCALAVIQSTFTCLARSPNAGAKANLARAGCRGNAGTKLAPRHFVFPRDDGAHAAFASEWWRTFGRVNDASGKRYDFDVNVSRFDVGSCGIARTAGGWTSHAVIATTWEILDESGLVVRRGSQTEREGTFGAHAREDALDLAATDVRYGRTSASAHGTTYRLELDAGADALAFRQEPGAPLPLGPGGVMPTGSCATCEAYAYAYPRSATRGTLRIDGVTHAVTGSTWIEHEFAARELAATDTGWSRYELQFDDGRDLDVRFTHDAGGRVVATSGTFVSAAGAITYLRDGDARLQNVMHTVWRSSPTGVTYPSLWSLSVPLARFSLATVELVLDQESRDAERSPYFAGAIVVERVGPPEADHGHGYVELTGYGAPVRL